VCCGFVLFLLSHCVVYYCYTLLYHNTLTLYVCVCHTQEKDYLGLFTYLAPSRGSNEPESIIRTRVRRLEPVRDWCLSRRCSRGWSGRRTTCYAGRAVECAPRLHRRRSVRRTSPSSTARTDSDRAGVVPASAADKQHSTNLFIRSLAFVRSIALRCKKISVYPPIFHGEFSTFWRNRGSV